jgi:hypothetical protein
VRIAPDLEIPVRELRGAERCNRLRPVRATHCDPGEELEADRRLRARLLWIGVDHDPVAPRRGKHHPLRDPPIGCDVRALIERLAVVAVSGFPAGVWIVNETIVERPGRTGAEG